MVKPPTASALPRVMACPASALYPAVYRVDASGTRGTAIHAFLHAVRRAGRAVALRGVPKAYRAVCEAIDVTALPIAGEPEVTFAWDYATDKGRQLGSGLDRDYSKAAPTEFVGTADLFEVRAGVVYVTDYKSGFMSVAPDSWQLKGLALFAARATGCNEAELTIFKIADDGRVYPTSVHLTAFDIDATADDLTKLAGRLNADAQKPLRSLPVVEGEHCRYCPAFTGCPAKTALVRNLDADLAGIDPEENLLTVEQLGAAHLRIERIQAVLKRIQGAIEDAAIMGPIPRPDGRVLREVEQSKESIDADIAYRVIADKYGAEMADRAVERKASKAGIKRALNGQSKTALALIDDAGGINTDVTHSVRVCDEP